MEKLATEFMSLFAGLDRAYGTYRLTDTRADGKQIGKAATVTAPVTLELWKDHLAGKSKGLGIVPIRDDATCVFGAIDIDEYIGLDHAELVRTLQRLSLPLIVCRSKSGGAHLYIFSKVPVSAALFQGKLREIAAMLGQGQAEIFPKQTKLLHERGDVGGWINMPYHNGDDGTRYAVNLEGNALSAVEFLAYAESSKQDLAFFETPIAAKDVLEQGPPCLQHLVTIGFPEGSRNNGLYNLAIYCRKRWPDDWKEHLEQLNRDHMDPPLPAAEVVATIKSVEVKEYYYTCAKIPIAPFCNAPMCRMRKYGVGDSAGSLPDLGGLTKMQTDPPMWFWTVGDRRIELTTEQLQNPTAFQRRCMDVINMMPPVPSRKAWQEIVSKHMETVAIIEIEDRTVSTEGRFWELFEAFCLRSRATGLADLLTGKPFVDGSSVSFRINDVVKFMERHELAVNARSVTVWVKSAGGIHDFKRLEKRGVNLWTLPFKTAEKVDEENVVVNQDAPVAVNPEDAPF